MSELLLELFSEEIPARMQKKAAEDFQKLVSAGLKEAGLTFDSARNYYTPRRLTLVIEGLPEKSPDVRDERKGPRVGAPEKALAGFLRGAGLESIDQAEVVSDPKKGDFYVAVIEKAGRATGEVVADVVPDVVRKFPWPKSMRWGSGKLRWVRPLHSIVCVLDGKAISFEVDGVKSGDTTKGHRFMAPDSFAVSGFADYQNKLKDAKVILDADERAAEILEQAKAVAKANKVELVEDAGLLAETAGLVEWPTVYMGGFDEPFLDVPPEVLTMSMKSHQKCFSVKKGDELSNNFMLVSNLIAEDDGKKIVNGNERVIRARLSDAKFFWDNDKERPLEDALPKLELVTFHEKLGTQRKRVERIKAIASDLSFAVEADVELVEQAAMLCKADLMSEIVNEFADLQGLAGQYIAARQGKDPEVAVACYEHYKPQGQGDDVPTSAVSIAVALADKLDTLSGFWAIDETPTGSKDPYALRRAALGVIRIVLENDLRLNLTSVVDPVFDLHWETIKPEVDPPKTEFAGKQVYVKSVELLDFFADRLKVYLRDKGARHDLIDAVFSLGGQDDLQMIVKRVGALGDFLATDDGESLLAGVKRAANILRIEEKKDKTTYNGEVNVSSLEHADEKALHKAIVTATKSAEKAIKSEDFEAAMTAMAKLRGPVDSFFDNVIVNDEDKAIRENRLNLLSQIREATRKVADFSRIEG